MVSAFWHGFYPNYYSFFFFCFMIEQTAGMLENNTSYFTFTESFKNHENIALRSVFYLLGGLNLNIMNFFGLYFSLLFLQDAWSLSKNMSFAQIIVLVGAYSYCMIAFKKKKESNKSKEKEKEKKSDSVEQNNDDSKRLIEKDVQTGEIENKPKVE